MAKNKKWIVVIIILLAVLFVISAVLYVNRGFIISKIAEKAFLKAGKPIKFGDYTILINKVDGDNLSGIRITGENRILEAARGDYKYLPESNSVEINLFDGTAEDNQPNSLFPKNKLTFKRYHVIFKIK